MPNHGASNRPSWQSPRNTLSVLPEDRDDDDEESQAHMSEQEKPAAERSSALSRDGAPQPPEEQPYDKGRGNPPVLKSYCKEMG